MWSPPYEIQSVSNVIVTSFDLGDDQANRLWRFPKRTVSLNYANIPRTGRDSLYAFWRNQHGPFKPFWFFDVVSRNWPDEYVGYQGPLSIDSACLFDVSASSYTDYTEQANSTASTDFPLMAGTSAFSTGDGPMIGSDIQFDKVTWTISTATPCSGTYVISPKYYSATGGWVSTTSSTDYADGTTGFQQSGSYTFPTPSSNWILAEFNGSNRYWMHFELTSLTTMTSRPWASQVTVDTKTFDLHARGGSSGNVSAVYINGSSVSSTAWSFASNGGGGGADRITFSAYNTSGALITSDLSSAYLRMKGRFADQNFPERQEVHTKWSAVIKINEKQW
jgi:hypothetical protein